MMKLTERTLYDDNIAMFEKHRIMMTEKHFMMMTVKEYDGDTKHRVIVTLRIL